MTLIIDEQQVSRLPVSIDPEVCSGAPVFRGTHVPVDACISNLETGLTLDTFFEIFSSVNRQQALGVLEFSRATLLKLGHTS